jgi:hypothetical protein
VFAATCHHSLSRFVLLDITPQLLASPEFPRAPSAFASSGQRSLVETPARDHHADDENRGD